MILTMLSTIVRFIVKTIQDIVLNIGFSILIHLIIVYSWLTGQKTQNDNVEEEQVNSSSSSSSSSSLAASSQIEASSIAKPFHIDDLPSQTIDTIVIGSGSGGYTCANLLAQSGQCVVVLEQHFRVGGCTHSFVKDACEWDTGLHYTTQAMSDKTERAGGIMDFMTKGKQKWTKLQDPYDEILFPDDGDDMLLNSFENEDNKLNQKKYSKKHHLNHSNHSKHSYSSYSFVSNCYQTVDLIMNQIDPNNDILRKRAYAYMDLCHEINNGFVSFGITKLIPKFFHFLFFKKIQNLFKIASFEVIHVQYAMLNLGYTIEQLYRCKELYFDESFQIESNISLRKLKAILTHPIGDYAVRPSEASMAAHGITMAHYSNGAAYTVGPTQNISNNCLNLVKKMGGGEVFVDACVQEILIEKGRAVGVLVCNTSKLITENQNHDHENHKIKLYEIRARNIVWASGVYHLYKNILPKHLKQVKEFKKDYFDQKIKQSDGHIYLFIKLKGNDIKLNLPKHNIWYFNSYLIDLNFQKYFSNPFIIKPPNIYIGFPCTKDVTWYDRYPNISNCILISNGLYEWFEKWSNDDKKNSPNNKIFLNYENNHNRGIDYDEIKLKLTNILLNILIDIFPQLKHNIIDSFMGTPLTEMKYFYSYHGGSYGTKCNVKMFSFNNLSKKWIFSSKINIPGLFLSGSDAFLPSVCGAMYGGCFCTCNVLGYPKSFFLGLKFLLYYVNNILEENKNLSQFEAFQIAFKKLIA